MESESTDPPDSDDGQVLCAGKASARFFGLCPPQYVVDTDEKRRDAIGEAHFSEARLNREAPVPFCAPR